MWCQGIKIHNSHGSLHTFLTAWLPSVYLPRKYCMSTILVVGSILVMVFWQVSLLICPERYIFYSIACKLILCMQTSMATEYRYRYFVQVMCYIWKPNCCRTTEKTNRLQSSGGSLFIPIISALDKSSRTTSRWCRHLRWVYFAGSKFLNGMVLNVFYD